MKILSACDYPRTPLVKLMADFINTSPVFEVSEVSGKVEAFGAVWESAEFMDRLYYATAMALFNRTPLTRQHLFNNTNPVIPPGSNSERFIESYFTMAEFESNTIEVTFRISGNAIKGELPLGAYHLISVAGHGYLEVTDTVTIHHELPTLKQVNCYAFWLRMEEH